jgi:hypothetical protein
LVALTIVLIGAENIAERTHRGPDRAKLSRTKALSNQCCHLRLTYDFACRHDIGTSRCAPTSRYI